MKCYAEECPRQASRTVQGYRLCAAHALRVDTHGWSLVEALNVPFRPRGEGPETKGWNAAVDTIVGLLGELWAETELLEAVKALRKATTRGQ